MKKNKMPETLIADQAHVTGLAAKGAAALIGCEESQAVTIELRALGIEAYSCDTEPCSGGHPEWHLQMDIFEAIKLRKWKLGIFFPPCTFLTKTRNKWFKEEYNDRFPGQHEQREKAVKFFMALYNCDIEYVAIENPVGIMSSRFRKADQYVHPYQFGHPERKLTGFWLKNLPLLKHTNIVEPEYAKDKSGKIFKCKRGFKDSPTHYRTLMIKDKNERAKIRSKTPVAIAKAMAEQWGLGVLAAAPFAACQ